MLSLRLSNRLPEAWYSALAPTGEFKKAPSNYLRFWYRWKWPTKSPKHAFRGEADLAFKWLERAYDQRDGSVSDIKSDRAMRKLAGDPRYKAFLRKLKLPE